MYEYVIKKEYKESVEKVLLLIKEYQHILKENYKITFQYQLIGSGSNKLITKKKNSKNKYDLDYNFIISKKKLLERYSAKELREIFLTVIIGLANKHSYKVDEKSSVIKIQFKDFSCDFAVIKEYKKDNVLTHEIAVKDKDNYIWNTKENIQDINKKTRLIRKRQKYNLVRDQYLVNKSTYHKKTQNNKMEEKSSYSIYVETINNIYEQEK